jgi:trk system potassium uptake protein TrkH
MYKHVLANLGFLLQIAGLLTVLPILVGLYLNEIQTLAPLFLTCISFLVSGFLMNALCERKDLDFKSSCVLILLAFVLMPLIGAIPYVYNDPFNSPNPADRFTNAYFESISGFTTTGFSFVSNTDALPRSFLIYRSMTELMGGVGIVFLLLAFFHSRKSLNHLGNALGIERIGNNLKRIFFSVFLIYGIYIIVFTIIFYILGTQDVIKAGTFAIDTITGGYQPSFGQFQQYLAIPIRISIIVLMFVGSVNFSFNYRLFTLKLKKAFSGETLLYLLIIIIATVLIFFLTGRGALTSLFHVVSMSSSTGYDYINIPMLNDTAKSIFILLMILGGCGFSMAGGIKMFRIISFFKSIKQSVKGILVKEKVIKEEKENKKIEENNVEQFSILVAIVLFIATLIVFSIIFSTIGVSFTDAIFEVGSALTTNGISMGATTVFMPIAYKWLLIISMIIGRIEIIPILIALSQYKKTE